MSEFYIDSKVTIIPIEELTANDGTTKARIIHSDIDMILSSSHEDDIGSATTDVQYSAYTTTTSFVSLQTIFTSGVATANVLFIKIVSAGSSGTPDVYLSTDAGSTYTYLSGVNDWVKMNPGTLYSNIQIKSSGATTVSNIQILVGR